MQLPYIAIFSVALVYVIPSSSSTVIKFVPSGRVWLKPETNSSARLAAAAFKAGEFVSAGLPFCVLYEFKEVNISDSKPVYLSALASTAVVGSVVVTGAVVVSGSVGGGSVVEGSVVVTGAVVTGFVVVGFVVVVVFSSAVVVTFFFL